MIKRTAVVSVMVSLMVVLFSYPSAGDGLDVFSAVGSGPSNRWSHLSWGREDGSGYGGDWSDVGNATLTLDGGDAGLIIDRQLTLPLLSIVVASGGRLTLSIPEGNPLPVLSAIDDSASAGSTLFSFGTGDASVSAGADTVLTRQGTGKLTVGTGKSATLQDVGAWGGQAVLAAGSLLRFSGTSVLDTVPYMHNANPGTLAVACPVKTDKLEFDKAGTFRFEEGMEIEVRKLATSFGYQAHQTFDQVGGEVRVTGTHGPDQPNDQNGVISDGVYLGKWYQSVTRYNLSGGHFSVPNTTICFGWSGLIHFTVGGGEKNAIFSAKGIQSGFGMNNGNTLTLKERGILAFGEEGINFSLAAPRLILEGGTLSPYAESTVKTVSQTRLNGSILVTNDFKLTLDTSLSGTGTVEKAGSGTLIFRKPLKMNGGTLIGDAGKMIVEEASELSRIRVRRGAQMDLQDIWTTKLDTIEVDGGGTLSLSGRTLVETDTLSLGGESTLEFHLTPSGSGGIKTASVALPGEAGKKVRLALRFGVPLPVGTAYTLLSCRGTELDPSLFELEALPPGFSGSLGSTDGKLTFTVTKSDSEPLRELRWANGSGNGRWDLTSANWIPAEGGGACPFLPYSPVLFPGTLSSSTVTVDMGVAVGAVREMGSGSLTLAGEKLGGNSPVLKGGSGVLVVDGGGFDSQKITVTNGILRIGPNARSGDALGSPGQPLEILGRGALDFNSVLPDPDLSKSSITYNKQLFLEGAGPDGRGALFNSGTNAVPHVLHTVKLTGDATVSSKWRWGVSSFLAVVLPKRGSVTGSGDTTLTVVGPMQLDTSHINFSDVDVNLGSLVIRDNGGITLEYGTTLNLPRGLVLSNGVIRSYQFSGTVTPPLRVLAGTVARVGSREWGLRFGGPITLEEEGILDLISGNVVLDGAVGGPGSVKVSGGSHTFASDMEQTGLRIEDGGVNILGAAGAVRRYPKDIELVRASSSLSLQPGENTVYEGLKISGPGVFWPSYLRDRDSFVSTLRNCTLSSGSLSIGRDTNRGLAVIGEGTTVNIGSLSLGATDSPKNSRLWIDEGAEVTVRDRFVIGEGLGQNSDEHWFFMQGGTLNLPAKFNKTPQTVIGNGGIRAYMVVNGGAVTAKGFDLRNPAGGFKGGFDQVADINRSDEAFAMNGGVLNLGSRGFFTGRGFSRRPQLYLNGGRLNLTENVPSLTREYMNFTFDRFEGVPRDDEGPFTLNLNNHNTLIPSGLQGRSDVVLTGSGNFSSGHLADPKRTCQIFGGVSGHWTVENTGLNDLNGAAAFSSGLTLAPDCRATVKIGSPDRFVSLGVFMNELYGERCFSFCTETNSYGMFAAKIRDFVTFNDRRWSIAYAFEGEFEVPETGDYTFACTYKDQARLTIDGTLACANDAPSRIALKSLPLTAGWHRFKFTLRNGWNNDAGVKPAGWKEKSMAVGWARGVVTDPSADLFTLFDTDTVPMRPAPTVWQVRAPRGSSGDWNAPVPFAPPSLQGTLQPLHDPSWPDAANGINEFYGHFLVEEGCGGEWSFTASFDDRIGLYIDGETVVETVHHSNPSTGTRSLSEGWHTFRIRTADFNTRGGAWQGRPALSFTSPVSAGALPFDERSLRIVAHPYGFIGGELALGEGSVLTNTADTPCRVVGRVVGTGTLSGPFTLDGAVLEAACTARGREAGCISFDHAEAKTLEKVGKIRVAFDSVPLLLTYSLGIPALGLETLDPEELQDRLECVISGQVVTGQRLRLLVDEGGSLILRNLKPQGTQIIVQ